MVTIDDQNRGDGREASNKPILTAREKGIILARELREVAVAHSQAFIEKGDMAAWMITEQTLEYARKGGEMFEWIFNLESGTEMSATQYLKGAATGRQRALFQRHAEQIRKMYDTLTGLLNDGTIERETDKVPVILRRVRGPDGRYSSYNLMAIFPDKANLLHLYGTQCPPDGEEVVIYMQSDAPCMHHACDALYKHLRAQENEAVVGSMNNTPRGEVYKRVIARGADEDGRIEFMDPETRELQDKNDYVLAGLLGFFSGGGVKRWCIPKEFLK